MEGGARVCDDLRCPPARGSYGCSQASSWRGRLGTEAEDRSSELGVLRLRKEKWREQAGDRDAGVFGSGMCRFSFPPPRLVFGVQRDTCRMIMHVLAMLCMSLKLILVVQAQTVPRAWFSGISAADDGWRNPRMRNSCRRRQMMGSREDEPRRP